MLIGMNWIQKTDLTIRKEKMNLNIIKNEISKWLKDLKEVFKTISERELLFSHEEVNYEINLKIKEIKSSLQISIKLEKQ